MLVPGFDLRRSLRARVRRIVIPLVALHALAACGDNKSPAAPDARPGDIPDASGPGTPTLHVPSPDWQDQIIYFVMTDRFHDGDPANNDQGAGEFDPADQRKYSGGDLQGVIDQLDYIEELGATAVWITPPVANLWWDPFVQFGGYHGYWAHDFKSVDPHLGTLGTYQALSSALHERGMYLVQDIVANHTGNFFTYVDENGVNRYDPANPTANLRFNEGAAPVSKPSQPPFDRNDPAAETGDAIYHWTPGIDDYNDPAQVLYGQLSDLDDLATENPEVRRALRDSYGYWIREVGVDAFRVDTVIYVEHEFWNDFMHGTSSDAPGMVSVAAATGRDDFLAFGEAFVGAPPLDDSGDRRVASYLGTEDQPELTSVLGFPMHFTMNQVFGEGKPTRHLGYRLATAQDTSIYRNPYIVPHFIDNHDVARFLSRGSQAGLEQALMFLMSIPGIPVIYYGTEQGFTETRASMFASGWGANGQDHFDRSSGLYQLIKTLTAMRKQHAVLRRGSVALLAEDVLGPGVFAFAREHEGKKALVIMNTADRATLLGNLATGLAAGTKLQVLASRGAGDAAEVIAGVDGAMTMALPARAAMVLLQTDAVVDVAAPAVAITVDTALEGRTFTDDITITGTVAYAGSAPRLQLVVDGNLDQPIAATVQADGTFSAVLPFALFTPGTAQHTAALYAPDANVASARATFTAEVGLRGDYTGSVTDPAGDDAGPAGYSYTLPTDASFGAQMDIRRVDAVASNSFLQIDVTMGEVTDVWAPIHGFDHVLFHIYIDVPGRAGVSVLPRIHASAPAGFAWDYMAFVEGWTNRFYASQGASASEYGQVVSPAAQILSADKATGTIRFLIAAESLGAPATLEGARIYVTTWDWNGPEAQYRALTQAGAPYEFGNGNGATDPLIIDDSAVLTLSAAAAQ
jgi:glycosidase